MCTFQWGTIMMADSQSNVFERLWTATEVAEYLGLHPQTIYKKANSGELPSVRVLTALRFEPAAIREWVAAQQPATEGTA